MAETEKKKTVAAVAQKAEKPKAKPAVQHAEKKAEAKTETVEKKVKKAKETVTPAKIKKSDAVKELRDIVKQKPCKPTFRGRFGCSKIRHKGIEKFSKWRHIRGIDTKRKKENGRWPRPGYGFNSETFSIHPSGFREVMVSNPQQLEKVQKDFAARISGTVGQKKRRMIVKKANELGIHVLNY